MASEPPTQNTLQFRRSWPPVTISEERETRRQHGTMFALMAITMAVTAAAPSVPTEFALGPAFIAGYALCNWVMFEDAYELEVEDAG